MATYAQLQTYFSNLMNRRTLTETQVQDFLQQGIRRIQRELRIPAMEKVLKITFDPTQPFAGLTIPNDMLELIDIINVKGLRLAKEDLTIVNQWMMGPPGMPRFYYRLGGTWLIGPPPNVLDPSVFMKVVYYGEFEPLINPTDTNVLSIIAPQLIVYAALCYCADLFTDSRLQQWESRYSQIKDELQGMADADELSGAACISPALFWPSDSVAYGWTPGSVGE